MFAIIILLILAWSFYIGYSRGIVLQGYYAAMTIVSMLVAGALYQGLAKSISLWVPYASAVKGSSTYFFANSQLFHLDKVFYAGLDVPRAAWLDQPRLTVLALVFSSRHRIYPLIYLP